MPTHIDHIVTEIVPEPETGGDSGPGDQRWLESQKLQAQLRQLDRLQQRLQAEAFDD